MAIDELLTMIGVITSKEAFLAAILEADWKYSDDFTAEGIIVSGITWEIINNFNCHYSWKTNISNMRAAAESLEYSRNGYDVNIRDGIEEICEMIEDKFENSRMLYL